ADPDVARDIVTALQHLVPADLPYRHGEGNSPAHVKAALIGSSCLVPVANGRLALGTWQGIFFAEFDGPRRRQVSVTLLARAGDTGTA
ncbi:MAG TPA: secondary thiamine-phosphate synthase enzyme YjbQ, partial [Chloroflexota bacterium]|nr:secondary thiamine-phosphate synthase enzyme YjbQ [Chloroflexota bacterium]